MPKMNCRLAFAALLLVVVSGSAAAEWVAIFRESAQTEYVDLSTIRRAGNMVKMWDLIDFKTVQSPGDPAVTLAKPFMSVRAQREYNCKDEQVRVLFVDFFSGNMLRGDIVSQGSNPGKWEPVPPGSIHAAYWKAACRKQ